MDKHCNNSFESQLVFFSTSLKQWIDPSFQGDLSTNGIKSLPSFKGPQSPHYLRFNIQTWYVWLLRYNHNFNSQIALYFPVSKPLCTCYFHSLDSSFCFFKFNSHLLQCSFRNNFFETFCIFTAYFI